MESGYKVLYRKYRPMFFSDVFGQPQVTVTLKNQLKSGRISHAYLFTGTRGTGKTTCAKILAKAVNCLNLKDGDPCGECEICRGLEEGSILDVVEIDAASNNGVDSIRSLIEESNFTPATAKYRVYIIDEVHMLSVSAFNALLKTLEEPPAHVIFILATTEVHKLLPTILSRCQRFDFKRVSPEDIADRLEYITKAENAEIDRDAAVKIARIADGGVRDAISILDQCLGRTNHVTLEVVNETAGVADRIYLQSLIVAVEQKDAARAIGLIAELYGQSKDMNRLCEEMAEYFRGMMITKTVKNPEEILTNDGEELKAMAAHAGKMKLSEIIHGLDTFEQTLNKMRYGSQRTELEMAFVRLCSPELDSSAEAVLRRLERLESGGMAQALSKTAERPKEKPEEAEEIPEEVIEESGPDEDLFDDFIREVKPEEIPEEPEIETTPETEETKLDEEKPLEGQISLGGEEPPAAEPSGETTEFARWNEVLEAMKDQAPKSIIAAFNGSKAYVSGGYILIEAPQIGFDLLKKADFRIKMKDAIRQVSGKNYNLGPYMGRLEEAEDPLELLARRIEEENEGEV